MARILVTGASGFIGWHLPPLLLARGHEVHLVCRSPDDVQWPEEIRRSCVVHAGDLCAQEASSQIVARARPTHIIHLAWDVRPGRFWSSLGNLEWVAASLRLFQAFAESGGERFIGCGTCAEYDWHFHTLSEAKTPLAPASLYGVAKARLFELLSKSAELGGPSVAWGRLFFPYGPRESAGRLVPDAITALLAGREVAVSEGRQVRDYVYVEDVARAFASLVDSNISGAVNIASGSGISIRSLLEIIAGQIGRPELLRFGARPTQPNEPPYMVADVRRLREELGCPAIVGIDEGIRQTVDWWRDQ